jgi:hypothetical protein
MRNRTEPAHTRPVARHAIEQSIEHVINHELKHATDIIHHAIGCIYIVVY